MRRKIVSGDVGNNWRSDLDVFGKMIYTSFIPLLEVVSCVDFILHRILNRFVSMP